MKLELDQDIAGILEPERVFDRRDFLTTALGASAALAASGTSAQQIVTDTVGLTAGDVTIKVADGTLPGYFAMPATGGPFAVILVAPEVFGLNPYMKDICRRLAKAGYYAITPDVYARKADLTKIPNIADIIPIVNAKTDTEMMADFDATAAFAKASGKGDIDRLGMTGFCRGGRTVWMYAAHNPKLRAAVAWYGTLAGKPSDAMPQVAARPCPDDQGAGAGPLRRQGQRHSAGRRGQDARRVEGQRQQIRIRRVCGGRTRLQRRFPSRQLSQAGCRGRLGPHARVVQAVGRRLSR